MSNWNRPTFCSILMLLWAAAALAQPATRADIAGSGAPSPAPVASTAADEGHKTIGAEAIKAAGEKAIAVEEAIRSLPADLKTPKRYALLIGASDYADQRIPNLPACANDVKALHALLTDPSIGLFNPDHVTVLIGKDVTPPKVKDALDQLARKTSGDDLVLVFFSGHGATDERGRAYWVMADTQADKPPRHRLA